MIAARLREEHRPHGGEAVDAHGVARLDEFLVGAEHPLLRLGGAWLGLGLWLGLG